jgi:AcrR family transcriptional regulator
LVAALELVSEVGAQGFSLREVARRAGVTHAAPYRHFASKESLVAALCEDGFNMMLKHMHDAMHAAGEDPLARFQAAAMGYLKFAVTCASHFRLMFGANSVNREQYPTLLDASHKGLAIVMDLVKACQRAGYFRTQQSSLELSLAGWSTVHGLASLYVDGQLRNLSLQLGDLETMGQLVAKAMLDGLFEPSHRSAAV